MDVFEAIRTRRSIRKYKTNPVPWDLVGKLLVAGKQAPSSGNVQDWKFIVVTEKEQREKIADACMQQWWMSEAPVHLVVVSETDKIKRMYGIRGERLYSIQNCAAATENILLAAHALGLGTCWVGAFDEHKLTSVVSMPGEVRPQSVITIGWPDEKVPEPSEYTIENVMYFRDWGGQSNRVKDYNVYHGRTGPRILKSIDKIKEGLRGVAEQAKKSKEERK